MNRWARIVLALSALGTFGWVGGGLLGWSVEDDSTLARHTLVAFGALLALLLCQGWIVVFMTVSERRLAGLDGVGEAERDAFSRARREAVIAAGLVLVAALAQFASSSLAFPAHFDRRWHVGGAAASLLLLVVAWSVEARAFARHGRAVDRVEAGSRRDA